MNVQELIAKLEAATEGSRELDIAVAFVTDKPASYTDRLNDDGSRAPSNVRCGHYTTSLDAALTLVPEHHRFLLDKRPYAEGRRDGYRAVVYRQADPEMPESSWAATPALALCIAALKARASQSEAP
jgi:hypothetical protein